MLDEVLNLFPAGLSERLRAAEVDGVGLDQFGVELVLADDLAQTVADLGASAIPVPICVLRRKLLNRIRNRSDFLDRADADAVGLAQGAVDGTSLGHPHLGAADERGNVGGIGVAIPNETCGLVRRENSCPKCPASACWIAEIADHLNLNANTAASRGQSQQSRMRDVPMSIETDNVSPANRKAEVGGEASQRSNEATR